MLNPYPMRLKYVAMFAKDLPDREQSHVHVIMLCYNDNFSCAGEKGCIHIYSEHKDAT